MESLKELYRSGVGPSSSHTMGPAAIARTIKENYPECDFVVDLYGSLSLTGKGHMTDAIMIKRFAPRPCRVNFLNESLPFHPNGMIVHVYPGGTLEGEKPVPQDAAVINVPAPVCGTIRRRNDAAGQRSSLGAAV